MKNCVMILIFVIYPIIGFSQSLSTISPNTANAGQTLNVTITGSNTHFSQGSGTAVYFGFNQGSGTINSLTVTSNTSLIVNVTVPVNTYTDYYDVYVYNSMDGYVVKYNGFYVNGLAIPSLVSISPNTANAGQTLNVTITGANTHFSQGSGTYLSFSFNQGSGTVVNSLNAVSNTSLLANITVPANIYTGDYSLYVSNSIDGNMYLSNSFHVNGLTPPSLISVSPNSANAGQTLNVTITGVSTHFTQGSGTSVGFSISGDNINSISVISVTSLLVNITIPSNTYTGDYSVYTYNQIDGYLFLENCFHINGILPPSLISVSPDAANAGQTLNVSITGSDTHFTQGSGTTVSFSFDQGSGVVNSVTILNNTSITANITVPVNTYTGDYTVHTYNSIDGNLYLYDSFHIYGITPPSLVSISPNTAEAGQTLNVTITGANTHFSQGSTSVSFSFNQGSGTVINSVNILNNTAIYANITVPPNTYTGDYSVYIYNSIDGYLALYSSFHIGNNSINENEKNIGALIYPNPASDKIYIKNTLNVICKGSNMCLYNLQGQIVYRQFIFEEITEIDIRFLDIGVYIVKIENSDGVSVIKRIIKH